MLAVALVALAYSPEFLNSHFGLLTNPEVQKGLVYLAVLTMAIIRGVDRRLILPVPAYLILALVSYVHGDLAPGLTEQQMASTFVTLTAGWVALAIKWDWVRDARYLKVIACIAPACVVFGVLLELAGQHSVWKTPTPFDNSLRLRGASIPAQLALTAYASCAASYVCHRLMRWRVAPFLLVLNICILALTLTRGVAAALAVAAVVPMLRYALRPMRFRRPATAMARLAVIAALGGVLAATLVPALEARNSGGRYYAGYGTVQDPTSGRLAAWKEFYDIAQQSPLFGHGLGSGPVTQIKTQGFLAQHNDYLRLFLEGGYVGGGLVLLAIVVAVATAIARAPRSIRLDLTGLAVGFAGLSFFDNTLTTVSLTVPLLMTLGLAASWRRRPAGHL
jgi:hypothetical protein